MKRFIGLGCIALALTTAGCKSRSAQAQPAPSALASAPAAAVRAPPKAACPSEMARVGTFCIDRWEAHTTVIGKQPRLHSPYARQAAHEKLRAVSAPDVVPQGYLSRLEAAAACGAAGKRLCRAREWYRACAGSEHRHHPYGNTKVRGACNTGKGHALTKLFGKHTTFTYDDHYNNPRVNQAPGFLARTGAFEKCVTPEGVFDMEGNLHEWVADDVSSALPKEIPLEYGENKLGPRGSGVFMGGYFSSQSEHGRGCAYTTATHAPDYHDYSTGFRCCRDAAK